MGFLNLFGGDKTSNTTTNQSTSIDASTTKTNSDNSSSWLQQNLAQIQNTVNTVNKKVTTTDSYNRTNLNMFADVGNIVPGSTVSPMLDSQSMANIFDSVLNHPITGLTPNSIAADPNSNSDGFNFAAQNATAAQVIAASGSQLGQFFRGVTDVSQATGAAPTKWYQSPWVWVGVAVVGFFVLKLSKR